MPLSAWRKWWRSRSAGVKTLRKRTPFRKCFLEILEDRTLLSANTYTVNLSGDAGKGSGLTGDIRYCINQADQLANVGSTIVFDTKAIGTNTIALSNGQLQITQDMTINNTAGAANLTISGNPNNPKFPTGASRVFDISDNAATVTISGLTIANGNAAVFYTTIPGNQGGDIYNGGTLTLKDDIVTNGLSAGVTGVGANGRGGAIYNAEGSNAATGAKLILDNTIVENSKAQGVDGLNGINGGPGSPGSPGMLGGAGLGGGIYNDINATLTIENDSQILNNQATGGSGGFGGNGGNGPNGVGGGPGTPGGAGGFGGNGGYADGGGLYNSGNVTIVGTSTASILFADNLSHGGQGGFGGNGGNGGSGSHGGFGGAGAAGGAGGLSAGGAVYNTGTLSVQYTQFLGNQAAGGAGNFGGLAGAGGNGSKTLGANGGVGGGGGAGGSAQGGGIYNANGTLAIPPILTIANTHFDVDAKGTPDQALGGAGALGGNGGAGGSSSKGFVGGAGSPGGVGGAGGSAKGGAVASPNSGGVSVTSSSFTSSLAQGGTGGTGGSAGIGGVGGASFFNTKSAGPAGVGGVGGSGAGGGAGGDATGGGIFSQNGNLTIATSSFVANQALGAKGGIGGNGNTGGKGGAGSSHFTGGTGGLGGAGATGGAGGAAQGGGFYSLLGVVNVTGSTFTANTSGVGNQAISGDGGAAGNGGTGGQGGDDGATKGIQIGGLGGRGGAGGGGGGGGEADGGSGGNQGGTNGTSTTLTKDTFTSSLVQTGSGGAGGNGGDGGESGNGNVANGRYGGGGGNGGDGGNSGPASGGAISVSTSSLTVTGSTFGGTSTALGNQILGGAGGAGGTGGTIGTYGHPSTLYSVFFGGDPAGDGGHGGAGSSVSGGAISVAPGTFPNSNINVLSSYQGLNLNDGFSNGGGFIPPDTQGAAGATNYVATANQLIGLFSPKDTGTNAQFDSFSDFFYNQGKLTKTSVNSELSDPVVVWDEQIQRFIVADQDVDFSGTNLSHFDIAISTSASPGDLTSASWSFFQVATEEAGYDADYPGNLGWNHDALVFTLNMFGASNHVLVTSVSLNDLMTLPSGTTLKLGTNAFQYDYAGFNLRPTVMHDSKAGDPMWFAEETNYGPQGSASLSNSISVVKMTNVLSSTATFTTTNLAVNPYYTATAELQPDGSAITFNTDSRIMKAAMQKGLLVAAQQVSDKNQDLDEIQWYIVDTTSGTPKLQQQGDISGGPNTYYAYPGIDINSAGEIGMSYVASGLKPNQFMSTYITGRVTTDPTGTMETPILIQAGSGLNFDGREGDLSGINVDSSDGSFWIDNEYTNSDWATAIAHFTVAPAKFVAPPQPVLITDSNFADNAITSGNGGMGGQAGLYSLDGDNAGLNGVGGDAGSATGGGIALSASVAQNATLQNDTVTGNQATGGTGGAGNINFVGATKSTAWIIPWNGFGSAGGAGGSVEGVGLAATDYNATISTSSFDNGIGQGGAGGAGGGASVSEPRAWQGGPAGAGGVVQGGGVYFSNGLLNITLNLSITGGAASGNQLTGGAGGNGGDAGASGSRTVNGGAGGAGGPAQGGGVYVNAGAQSVNLSSLAGFTLSGNQITGGTGGNGGAGSNAPGGLGGVAEGGAVYDSSSNTSKNSSLNFTANTVFSNQATGGHGGDAGSASTPNGGAGGAGGAGGNALGGGFYNGDNVFATLVNSTFGGGALGGSPLSNVVSGTFGGAGGDAGVPIGVLKNDGGPGGDGSSVEGANIYTAAAGSTVLTNDTVVYGNASPPGAGGRGGLGAGQGGLPGPRGNAGTAAAGGYFGAPGSSNTIANTILALNTALVNGVSTDSDVNGTFTSKGNNLLTTTTGSSGFDTSSTGKDHIVTSSTLNLGPLLDNGGPTWTDALLANSAAIDAGNTALAVDANGQPLTTDQRGAGFPRISGVAVDVGAFELQLPVITNLSPNSAVEQSNGFTMTITGTGFEPNATVSFGGTILTPTNITPTQITVIVPGPMPDEGAGSLNVMVSNPDGSGVGGQVVTSAASPFQITEGATLTLSNPGDQTNNEADKVTLPAITSSDPDTTFSATGLPPGLSINAASGIISGTITKYGAGTYNVTVNGTDDGVIRGTITFTWTVNDTTPPGFDNPGNLTNNEGDPIKSLATNPVDADAGSITATGLPPGLSIDSTTGVISGTIDPYGAGTYNVTIKATDGTVVGTIAFVWTVNDTTPPSFTNPGNQTSNEGDPVKSVATNPIDADAGSITATGLPKGLSIDSTTGVISGTIDPYGAGSYTVTVSGKDGTLTGTTTFTWTVKDTTPPSFTNPGNQSNNEGDQIKGLATNPVDTDAGSITATGLPPGLSINSTTGVISGTIDTHGEGTYNVTLSTTDGALTGKTTFTWTINDTTPPSFTNPPGNQKNNEGDSVNLAVTANDADSFSATGLPPGLSIQNVNKNGVISGLISGKITQPGDGTYNVTVNATDNGHTSSISLVWTVADNLPPQLTNPGKQSSQEGDKVSLQISAVDADSFKATGLPPGLTIDNSGLISGTIPHPGDGTFNVTVTASDGTLSSQIAFTWTVADNLPPSFTNPGDQTNNEGDPIASLVTNPVDADAGTITATGLPPGLSIDSTTGVISGTIDKYADGTYTVIVSGKDGTLTGTTTFTWTVRDNTPPSFTIGNQTSNEGDQIKALATNPLDADSDSITATGLPPGLSIDSNTGVITGTIDPRGAGTYSVTLSSTDGAITGTTTFIWTVNDTTPPSFTNPGNQTNNEGDQVTAIALNPVDADPGSITVTGLPTGLSFDSSTNVISGTIDSRAAGTYTVTVSGTDGKVTGKITFTWTVNDTTPPSLSNPGNQNSNEGNPVVLSLHPVDADPGSITATGLPPGLSINSTTGVISGTIDPRGAGTYGVTVSAADGKLSTSVSFIWTVNDTTPPVLINPGTQSSNGAVSISLPINAGDADAGSFSASGLPGGLSINANTGVISGTISGSPGTYSVTVSASDGGVMGSVAFPWVVHQMSTQAVFSTIHTNYVGLFQLETIAALVTDPNGVPVSEGFVTFQLNGQSITAPVVNGFAMATIQTPLLSLDPTVLMNDFFQHALNAVFSDPNGIFGSTAIAVTEPPLLLDFLLFLLSAESLQPT